MTTLGNAKDVMEQARTRYAAALRDRDNAELAVKQAFHEFTEATHHFQQMQQAEIEKKRD